MGIGTMSWLHRCPGNMSSNLYIPITMHKYFFLYLNFIHQTKTLRTELGPAEVFF